MSAVPDGVSCIKFRDRDANGWYGIVLASKDDKAKVFRASTYDLVVVSRGDFTLMPDNPVPKAARLWADSLRGNTASAATRGLLEKLASLEYKAPGVQHV